MKRDLVTSATVVLIVLLLLILSLGFNNKATDVLRK